ncbi:putative lectin-domain containing receptor kinase VI.4 RLK-Pelle-L-LEC family [Arabidopsis thaliana]|jgi:serine/threonine protein kinase|uniref:Lectin-domain containing receptor kinase VI.4 n=4 Tax=Arabidopsis TaxID=3701 RepID=LRK64_ARATH|nr:lectin receptor kinase a4.3 [Arabidopsis thaliana]Q66GN2.1 RecName: Full=Lectin-domain containing receptor kinase VI.4; Short=LecRK-VI.4; AltName: Full=Lectin receptor kinase A4.3; Flags: Precursor [Arabidopsis thaliana]KAG7600802.1 Protein kinase domain [Arabidopsis thaliana x Arabidopsis arenosa]AAU05493.1 At5g01560 [Arabidopsis thaliana]AED90360.1 lectin receptor kinase a4.3 [Arabidopsis thaliana]OAO90994.1 LECRKA4.3 [Arabidopsis thaliana]|eukprot:NP_195776.2 lectin receptor kinase a4.3 [Arabidopsis thaliana]
MGRAKSMVSLLLVLFLVRAHVATTETTTEFIFHGFKGNQSEIHMQGDSTITSNGLLRLTDRNSDVVGTAFYHKPVRLLDSNSTNTTVRSFSTSFIFIIPSSSTSNGGFGFTFTLSPTPNRTDADPEQYMGLLNERNDGNSSNHVFAVEFDTVQGFKDGTNRIGNHIGLNFNSLSSDVQEPVAYFNNNDSQKEEFQLVSGEPIQVFLDYHGPTKTLNLTVYPTRLGYKPRIPLISREVPKLSDIVVDEMFVGFTAATGRHGQSSAHYVMGWSFASGGEHPLAAMLDISQLPPPPPNKAKKRGYNGKVIALIVALSTVISIMLVLLFLFMMYKKRMQQEEILEDWEIDHPHRFRYRDLYKATEGFKENRVVGTGGFGIVYRGNIRSSSDQIAVKKITPNSMQGVREFVAEIESLGRLRHKNLVNLQGWCKHRNDLLLIYDYIPNGSLDSLLYSKPRRSGAVLSWNARFQIAKGIASGLLYLHEEWEQIVIHRDVKPSNVLIDSDMNPRLGDFGLARLYERGSQSCTTVVVGTIGYMAPELARNGNSSSASDVFAFGVLLLEIVSGRKPTDSGTFFIADWVMELQASGEILSAIDPRLGSGYDEGEARLALAVGLLCCHHKPESRPLMRMVLRYLNRDEDVPEIHDNWGYSDSSRTDLGSKLVGYISSDRASSSHSHTSSSLTRISSTSLISGR